MKKEKLKNKNVMQSFQMPFRPKDISGEMDLECVQILVSLCKRKLALQQQEQNDVLVAKTLCGSFLQAFSARNAAIATAAMFGMVAVGVALAAKLRLLG